MKKKKRKSLKKTSRKQKHPLRQLFSKPYLLSISIVLSLIIFIYATYAWNTAADEKTNKFSGTRLSAMISEEFSPNLQWQPETETDKVIQVVNNGEAAAFVRLSLDEYLMNFVVNVRDHQDGADKDGNGNLQITNEPEKATITFDNFLDWKKILDEDKGAFYQFKENPNEYYIGKESVQNQNFVYPSGSEERKNTPLKYMTIHFTDRVKSDPDEAKDQPEENRKNNWFYADGYFYFTSVLYPGELTTPLTKSVRLSEALPNKYKGSLYVIDVQLDAIDIFDGSLQAEWGIEKDNPVYGVLEKHIITENK